LVAGLLTASLDILVVFLAGGITICTVPPFHLDQWEGLPQFLHSSQGVYVMYLMWFAMCLVFFMRSYGLYRPILQMNALQELRMTTHAVIVAGLTLCGTLYLTSGISLSHLEVALTVLFSGVLLSSYRALRRYLLYKRHREGIQTRNVLIIGTGPVAYALRHHLNSLDHLGFRFKGFISFSEEDVHSGDVDIIGDCDNWAMLARSLFVDEIFLSVPADEQFVLDLVRQARANGIDVGVIPDLYNGLAFNARVEYIGPFPTIPLHRSTMSVGGVLIKRAIDLTIATFLLLMLAPVLAIIAIVIKLNSPGAVFYAAKRIGHKGRTFDCYKFRTMVEDADQLKASLSNQNERDGILFKITNDPRVTRIGQLLRKYSLDELPQLYNVIRGDMSLVGPRPPVASEVAQYDLSDLRRLDVLPGLTGLWQVEARQDPSFDNYISLDTAYIENWSLLLDIKILARTVAVVLAGTGS
jgi:exopolysaccharide biosynthesis polyprenyl glycosylphosphotransferase